MAFVNIPPTILVFDTGLGGLTVLREIVRLRDDAHYIYVADDAFFPYGPRGEEEVIARLVPLIGDLISAHHPDIIVIACNTASTLVMPHLRERYSVPFVGTVPAIKPACEVTLVGSAELATLAETALSGGTASDEAILAELTPCFVGAGEEASQRTDTIVLACTHYPLLLDRLNRLAPWPVDWIDPAPAIARRATSLLSEPRGKTDEAGAQMIFTSGRPHRLSEALVPFFGGRVPA